MSKSTVIGVTVENGGVLACVTQVPVGHVRRGLDPKKPFRWTISHKSGRLQWVRTLAEALRELAKTYPNVRRQLVWEGVNPHRARRKAA